MPFFGDVLGEVARKQSRHAVCPAELGRARVRHVHQRHTCADDLMHEHQKIENDGSNFRAGPEAPVGGVQLLARGLQSGMQ